MINKVPKSELTNRMNRFTSALGSAHEDWELCALVGGMSIYYLTGTICDGVLLIKRDEPATLWVRRSYDRAVIESEFDDIRPMTSFREIAAEFADKKLPETLYLDMSAATMEWYSMFSKYLKFAAVKPVDAVMLETRAVKSEYEIGLMKRAGETLERLLITELPGMLREGISEAELGADLYALFVKNGYHGISRFSMRNADVVLGHIDFGASSLYPSVFTGASGIVGLCPAAPLLGSRDVKLAIGDLVYIDIGFGIDGYNIDKTLVYSFGKPQPDYVRDIHNHCLEIETYAASLLRAGAKPSDVYNAALAMVKPELRGNFMGAAGRTVKFLGHGVGLYIDEYPVIANGFDKPIEVGMTIAIEPKISIDGVGLAGTENTYLITENGAVSLTGAGREIISV